MRLRLGPNSRAGGNVRATTRRFRLALAAYLVLAVLACVSGNARVRLFAPVTAEELAAIVESWTVAPHVGDPIDIVRETTVQTPTTRGAVVIGHEPQGRAHFGVLIEPTVVRPHPPLCVFIHDRALDVLQGRGDPTVNLDELIALVQDLAPSLSDCALLIPATRGTTLEVDGLRFSAQGEVCDAFAGAVEDTLALIDAVDILELGVDTRHIMAMGIGRGGTVAQLMGIRDTRVHSAIAIASPSDFHRETVLDHYGSAYRCAFLDGRHSQNARVTILASSPLQFADLAAPTLLIHDLHDPEVPVWHSQEMQLALRRERVAVELSGPEASVHGLAPEDEDSRALIDETVQAFLAAQPEFEDPSQASTSPTPGDSDASDSGTTTDDQGDGEVTSDQGELTTESSTDTDGSM